MALQLVVKIVAGRKQSAVFQKPVDLYAERLALFASLELITYATEAALLEPPKQRPRASSLLVLLDSRAKSFSSEAFADWLGKERDTSRQSIIFGIGPASGWSAEARGKADLLLSLGPMTLPHELTRVVLLEQIYRAFTILTGHPYHTGH